MPRRIDLGPGYGVVSWPDDATDEQIVADYERLEALRESEVRKAKLINLRLADLAEKERPTFEKTALQAALGVEEGLGENIISAGGALQMFAPTAQQRGAAGQDVPEGFKQPELARGPTGIGVPVGFGFNAPTARFLGQRLVEIGREKRDRAREESEQLGGGVPAQYAKEATQMGTVSLATLPVAAVAGVPGAAIAGGLQAFGLIREQWKDQLLKQDPSLTEQQAYDKAYGPAALSAVATAGLTRYFGSKGIEGLVERIAKGQIGKSGVQEFIRDIVKSSIPEVPEEVLQELSDQIIEKASINPKKTLDEMIWEAVSVAPSAFGLGVFAGGAAGGIARTGRAAAQKIEEGVYARRIRRAATEPSTQETEARAKAYAEDLSQRLAERQADEYASRVRRAAEEARQQQIYSGRLRRSAAQPSTQGKQTRAKAYAAEFLSRPRGSLAGVTVTLPSTPGGPSAESIRTQTGPGSTVGQQTPLEPGAQTPIQVRSPEGDRVEAQPGAPVTAHPIVGQVILVPKQLTTTSQPQDVAVTVVSVTEGRSRTGKRMLVFEFDDGTSEGVQTERGQGEATLSDNEAWELAIRRRRGKPQSTATPPAAPTPVTPPAPTPAARPVAQFGGYLFDDPNQPSFQIPGSRPGIMRNVNAEQARAEGYEVPPIPSFQEWTASRTPAAAAPAPAPAAPVTPAAPAPPAKRAALLAIASPEVVQATKRRMGAALGRHISELNKMLKVAEKAGNAQQVEALKKELRELDNTRRASNRMDLRPVTNRKIAQFNNKASRLEADAQKRWGTAPTTEGTQVREIPQSQLLIRDFDDELLIRRSKADPTVAGYRAAVEDFKRWYEFTRGKPMDWSAPVADDFVEYQSALRSRGFGHSGIRSRFSGLRSFFEFLERRGIVKNSPIPNYVVPWTRKPRVIKGVLTPEQIELLLEAPLKIKGAQSPAILIRDAAILQMMYSAGLRNAELAGMLVQDIDWENKTITVRGKGRGKPKVRTIPIDQSALDAIRMYWDLLPAPPGPTQPVFLNAAGNGPISVPVLQENLKKYARVAGITGAITPHKLRHSFATHYLESKTSATSTEEEKAEVLKEVQALLGHAWQSTTDLYLALRAGRTTPPGGRPIPAMGSIQDALAHRQQLINDQLLEEDKNFNPEKTATETNLDKLADILVKALLAGFEAPQTGRYGGPSYGFSYNLDSDRFLSAFIAKLRLQELGGTLSHLSRAATKAGVGRTGSKGKRVAAFSDFAAKISDFIQLDPQGQWKRGYRKKGAKGDAAFQLAGLIKSKAARETVVKQAVIAQATPQQRQAIELAISKVNEFNSTSNQAVLNEAKAALDSAFQPVIAEALWENIYFQPGKGPWTVDKALAAIGPAQTGRFTERLDPSQRPKTYAELNDELVLYSDPLNLGQEIKQAIRPFPFSLTKVSKILEYLDGQPINSPLTEDEIQLAQTIQRDLPELVDKYRRLAQGEQTSQREYLANQLQENGWDMGDALFAMQWWAEIKNEDAIRESERALFKRLHAKQANLQQTHPKLAEFIEDVLAGLTAEQRWEKQMREKAGGDEGTSFSAEPVGRTSGPTMVQVRLADGRVVDAEFTGYYDFRETGGGTVPGVTRIFPDGRRVHAPLAANEQILGIYPSFQQWAGPVDPNEINIRAQEIRQVAAAPAEAMVGGRVTKGHQPINWQSFVNQSPGTLVTVLPQVLVDQLRNGTIDAGSASNAVLMHLLSNRPTPLIYLDTAGLPQETGKHGSYIKDKNSPIAMVEVLTKGYTGQDVSQAEFVKTLNHELLHDIAERYDNADPILKKDIDDLFAFVSSHMQSSNKWKDHNANKDIYEFLVEATSNPGLQKFMLGLDYSEQIRKEIRDGKLVPAIQDKSILESAWGGFLSILKRLFGFGDTVVGPNGEVIDGITALHQAVNVMTLLEQADIGEGLGGTATAERLDPAHNPDAGPQNPQFFKTEKQFRAAISDPLLTATQRQQNTDLAAVQASMSPDNLVLWLMASSRNKAEQYAREQLEYIELRRWLVMQPRRLSSLPTGTSDQERAAELAGALVLGHYGLDRRKRQEMESEIEADAKAMEKAVKKLAKLDSAERKSGFLDGLIKKLTTEYKIYISNRIADAPAAANLQAQWRERLADAERRLNEQAQSPTAVKKALSAIASQIPANLLQPGTTNQQVIDWILQQGLLVNEVGQDVREWMTVDDGTGSPALFGYQSLVKDLATLRDVLTNQAEVDADITAFEQFFAPNAEKPRQISPKRFAENYFRFRTARDRALRVASMIEGEIDKIHNRIQGNNIALDKLQELMNSDDYVEQVRLAKEKADVVVRSQYDYQGFKTGLIERDRLTGLTRMKGPITGEIYTVDLFPSSATEVGTRDASGKILTPGNMGNLNNFVYELRTFARLSKQNLKNPELRQADDPDPDPILADEYEKLSAWIEKHMMLPSFDPHQGFTQSPWIRIPGTGILRGVGPYDSATHVTSGVGFSFQTTRDVIQRIGGRTTNQMVRDAYELDKVMRAVEGVNAHKEYGYAAQTKAVLKALESHGWGGSMFPMWNDQIVEKVLAAGQNNLGPTYEIGDQIVGTIVNLTKEDVAALKLMKQWSDAIRKVAPAHIEDLLGDLGVLRKAVGTGRYTMARIPAFWTTQFLTAWKEAPTDELKLKLLRNPSNFRNVVLGLISEFNPEFNLMNPASPEKSKFFEIYRKMAKTEMSGIQTFTTLDEVLDFMATEIVEASKRANPDGVATITLPDARKQALDGMFGEIKSFVNAFETNVLGKKNKNVWGAVPDAIVDYATANNAFTTPRGTLQAPSSFYSYSTAGDGRRWIHVGSLRSLLNLNLLQSGFEALLVLENAKKKFEQRVADLIDEGFSQQEARKIMYKESVASRKASDIRYDYKELLLAIDGLHNAIGNLERYEKSTADHYPHAGIAALNNTFGTIKSFLLSSAQAITTNSISGMLFGPAIIHLQTGQMMKAILDVFPATHMWKTVFKYVSSLVASNPAMNKILNSNAPFFQWMAKGITEAAIDWGRMKRIAADSGMVNPYNLNTVLDNKAALKATAGRLEPDNLADQGWFVELMNRIGSAPVFRHFAETTKAFAPRIFDNMINYTLITAFDHELQFLKDVGWTAFQKREVEATANGRDFEDLTDANNVLQPGDLGLRSFKALNRYREIFAPLGSLDGVLLDYYLRTKGMTKEQREAEPLITDDAEYAGMAVNYASITNLATESNRPYSFKGKGSDGVWRNIAGTFMGWGVNMSKELSRILQTHSKDPDFDVYANNFLAVATLVMLLSVVGAFSWEVGDELTKLLYDTSSARIQPGNVIRGIQQGDWRTAFNYFIQSLINVVPVYGSALGGFFGIGYTGRGSPLDLTSISPQLGFVNDSWNTIRRIVQTGDVVLPLADFTRRWIPLSKVVINRVAPADLRGIVAQQNAVRSLNGSAPPGTEIKWGQRGGVAKYSPANDEVMKLLGSFYEAAQYGGSLDHVRERYKAAIAAFVKEGRSEADAIKAVGNALQAKEPIRVLTGKELTPDEAKRWIARMTPEQKRDWDIAVKALRIGSEITGKNLNMVNTGPAGGPITGGAIGPDVAAMNQYIGLAGQAARGPLDYYQSYLRGPRATGIPSLRSRGLRRPRFRTGRAAGIRRGPVVRRPRQRLRRLSGFDRRIRRRTNRRRRTARFE